MPSYQDAINRVSQKLRDVGAWPDDATKIDEQLMLLYVAGLTVARSVPLHRLTLVNSGALSPSIPGPSENVDLYELPGNVFRIRDDLGVAFVVLDDRFNDLRFGLPLNSFLRLSTNTLYRDRTLFSLDYSSKKLFVMNADDVKIRHVPIFTKPASASVDFPLPEDTDFEFACSIVSNHVAGETTRDAAQANFQAFLTQLYGDA